ncbi:MAG TPA: tetratricopeptide repeat protein [Candidatus Eisenbacteria bacterium]|nr:tetratricopeptide repeat protein [Candidatus Eisenbacteria bacterium]
MTRTTTRLAAVGIALGLAGCATQADLIAQERRLQSQISDQRKQIQAIQRELERVRGDLDVPVQRPPQEHVMTDEERKQLEAAKHPPDQEPPPDAGTPPPDKTASVPPPPPVPPPAPSEDVWARDVSRDQAAMAASNAPERADLAPIMDNVAKKDCGKAVGQLNSFAAQKKESPLASSALYWAARCYALKGDRNQAISKFYDVVTKYPRGSKAPAALWEQGNLFIEIGDTPDARLALGKLIKDYPNSEEAGRARKRLTELDR